MKTMHLQRRLIASLFLTWLYPQLTYCQESEDLSALSVKDDYSRVKPQAEPAKPTVSATKVKKVKQAKAASLFDDWERTGDWADTEQTTEPAETTRSGWDFFKSLVAENLGVEAPPPPANSTADTTEDDAVARDEAAAVTTDPTPPCSILLPVDFSRGVRCWNDTEVWSRDLVMEKVLSQLWKTFDPMAARINQTDNTGAVSSGLDLTAGSRLEPLGGGNTVWLDPLNISAVLPGDGFLHVDQTTGYFSADLWMWNITLRGLGQGYLNDVIITRNKDLTEMKIAVEFRLDNLVASGTYNVTGWLGWDWFLMDSNGTRPFQAAMVNGTLSPQITIDANAGCDAEGNAAITEMNVPLLYDAITFNMENLDKAFDTVIQGALVLVIETQNMLAVSALRTLLSNTVGSLVCP